MFESNWKYVTTMTRIRQEEDSNIQGKVFQKSFPHKINVE